MTRLKIKKIVPFLLSFCIISFILWVEFASTTQSHTAEIFHNYFKRLDYLAYDLKMVFRTEVTHYPPHPIAIVAIDDNSLQQEGSWPWSYSKIANLIAKLREQGVLVIASDVLLQTAEQNVIELVKNKLIDSTVNHALFIRELNKLVPDFDDNKKLIQQVRNKNDIVLPFLLFKTHYQQGDLPNPLMILSPEDVNRLSILEMPGFITNFKALQRVSTHNGFLSTLSDEDGVMRSTPIVLRYQDKVYPSLVLAVAELLFPEKKIKLNTIDIHGLKYLDSIQFGQRRIPTDQGGRVLIPFHGKSHSFKYYSATDILNNKLNPGELKHAVVFIGNTTAQSSNVSNTPVDTAMPNVEVYASVLSGILDNNIPHLAYWSKAATIILILIIGFLMTWLLPILRPELSVLLGAGFFLSLILLNFLLWISKNIVFSFSGPVAMTILLVLVHMTYGFLSESRKKKFLREAFGHYLAPDYVSILLEHSDEYSLEGESVELTVLFADIRNFTTITEHLNAADIKKLLNHYFSPMTQIILDHGGTIDKYVGDMIMAFWGAPIKNPQHREVALEAALDMLAKSEELKFDFLREGLPEVSIGIGINTGVMNVGDMGSEFRRSYTVLGDPVNLGSRLESATKYYGVRLLVGSATRAGQTQFVFRLLDRVKVKGRHEAVDVYEVICRIEDASPELLQEIAAHEEALSTYYLKNWVLARKLFKSLATQHPDTVVYQLFLERIAYFEKSPPGADWDGTYTRTDK